MKANVRFARIAALQFVANLHGLSNTEAIDRVYDRLDQLCLAGRFLEVRTILELIERESVFGWRALPLAVLLSALTEIRPWHEKLEPEASKFYAAVRVRIQQEDRPMEMLAGLEPK